MAVPKAIFVGGNGGIATARRDRTWQRAGAALSLRVRRPEELPHPARAVPQDPGGPDVPLQLRSAGGEARRPPADCHRRSQPVDDDRRDRAAAGAPHLDQGRHALADQRHPQEDRAVAARAGRSQRRLRPRRHRRRRELRRDHLDREADGRDRYQPHHPPGRHHDLYRLAAALPAIFTSRRATTPWSSSTASTACCSRPCSPSRKSITRPSSRVSRS